MKTILAIIVATFAFPVLADGYRGQLTVNPYTPNAVSPYEARPQYGGAKLYDSQGQYRGTLNNNRYDSESVANPYGRYGSQYSPDSVNNPYGAGSRYKADSPNNPYGSGWSIQD
ncbi:MAG: hypothetical protein WCX93_12315 [Burkholderiaceae bacterium]